MHAYRNRNRGFTLVEILIVVIILGILAAIVIPQFSNASTDARMNSARSLVQTIRAQLELYKMQHNDQLPVNESGEWQWKLLTERGDDGYGPYLQQIPANPLRNGATGVIANATTTSDTGIGFGFDPATGKFWAFDADGNILDPATTEDEDNN